MNRFFISDETIFSYTGIMRVQKCVASNDVADDDDHAQYKLTYFVIDCYVIFEAI